MQQPEQRASRDNAEPEQRTRRQEMRPIFVTFDHRPPPSCFSRPHRGAAAALDSRGPRRRVAPSPGRDAADRGRNLSSSPGARPGSAARLPPGPEPRWVLVRAAPARRPARPGLQPARTAAHAAREHRESPGKPKHPSAPLKTRADELARDVKRKTLASTELTEGEC